MKVKNLNSHIEHIINGYKQQYRRYEQLLALSQQLLNRPADSNSADYIESFEQNLRKRSEIIDNIKEIENNISMHKEAVMDLLHLKEFNLEKVQDLVYPNLREELEEQRRSIEQAIKEIIDTDRKNEEALKTQMMNVTSELRSIQQHYELQQTYLDRPEKFPEPRFIDKKK